MIAYKFLKPGRVGRFSQFHWPEPGVWVHSTNDVASCRRGIHACRTHDLPWWLAEELWEVELDGRVELGEHKIVAPTGRLRAQIAEWTPTCAQDYATACASRARDRAVQALGQAGHPREAEELATRSTLDDVLLSARRLAKDTPDTRISLTIAGDSAESALAGAAPASAYIAAHAAMRLDGPAGYASERAWQTRWLVERLGLNPDR
jgi:hypothetical protein